MFLYVCTARAKPLTHREPGEDGAWQRRTLLLILSRGQGLWCQHLHRDVGEMLRGNTHLKFSEQRLAKFSVRILIFQSILHAHIP